MTDESFDIVIVGATGNLARRKLIPALYDLQVQDLLPDRGSIVGLARSPFTDDQFRGLAREAAQKSARLPWDEGVWDQLAQRLSFVQLTDEGFEKLRRRLHQPQRLVYLAVPPGAFGETVRALAAEGLAQGTRLLIEKPFGRDLDSACRLDAELREVLDESQIFRIDHYLGKETVQNILVFRFGNSVFERVWNRDAIHHIEITVAEAAGIDGRGSFYEEVGALRDVVQNHLLQVLSLLTMEPPASFDAEAVRDEKVKLLKAVRPFDPKHMVRAQYTRGRVDGVEVPGYADEEDVAPGSDVETFVAVRVAIENWRWAGVPIYLRTGKRLPVYATEIEIAFNDVPAPFFEATGVEALQPNTLTLSIQPQEEITFSFLAKVPGPQIGVKPVEMNFSYDSTATVEPYERLIRDAIEGDQTLFVRADSVERAWQIVQPALDQPPPLHLYEAGTWGPEEADELIAPVRWHLR